ncbi:Fc.00g112350.m01.CDS01 [Cosmosporella sp. VM-42]
MHTSTLVLGLSALLSGAAQAQYTIGTTYDASNFFSTFDFFTDDDPTRGFVEYVDANTANAEGYAGFVDGAIYMGVDFKTANPQNGRKSVRVTSQQAFTHGLFIADIAHMPGSIPGVWPAMWMFGPEWPGSGEIDILEGVNTQTENAITLHTSEGCSITNEGTAEGTTLKGSNCNEGNGNTGCSQGTSDNTNYGDGFNDNGGGVYATEWTSDHISVWFFPRSRIPQDIANSTPDPSTWGNPTAKFNGGSGCDIDKHFKNNNFVFDTTFCGDWAGSPDVWNNNPETSALAATCNEYVAAHPEAFENAYWLVNSIKVFNQGGSPANATAKRTVVPKPFLA